jgi:molybdenum cofactor cytidylyltransferase
VCAALDGVPATIVENPDWARGLSTSLARAISALPAGAECAVVALGDQPGLSGEVARAVVARWRDSRSPIVVARYLDGRGHPALFARAVFGELLALEGDQGARRVIEGSPDRVAFVDVAGPMPADVDTAEDLRTLSRPAPSM